ncbi:MAG: hypothetical protein P8X47_12250 [Ignavibacteriaceae bacterium]|jgi:hypothetical protein
MKTIGKVFFGVLFVILFFSFSHASSDNTCTPNNESKVVRTKDTVKFEWKWKSEDKIDGIIMYQVYRFPRTNNEQPPGDPDNFKYGNPIKNDKLNCVITFDDAGKYILGVQTLLYRSKDGKPIGEPIKKSTISWSCNKNYTENNPQYVEYSSSN